MKFALLQSVILESEGENYRGQHEAPDHDDGAPFWDLTQNAIYPDDVYDAVGFRYYCNEPREHEVLNTAWGYRNKPNRFITIYRTVPKDLPLAEKKIKPGDWVTTVRGYAVEHGKANLRNQFSIMTKLVHARDIFTEGNSLLEWGYDPQPPVAKPRVEKPNEGDAPQ